MRSWLEPFGETPLKIRLAVTLAKPRFKLFRTYILVPGIANPICNFIIQLTVPSLIPTLSFLIQCPGLESWITGSILATKVWMPFEGTMNFF